jgi:hypothetical protein
MKPIFEDDNHKIVYDESYRSFKFFKKKIDAFNNKYWHLISSYQNTDTSSIEGAIFNILMFHKTFAEKLQS